MVLPQGEAHLLVVSNLMAMGGRQSIALGLVLAYASLPVVSNLMAMGGRQSMNDSFGSFKILNTYGAFGSINQKRTEVILKGTAATSLSGGDIEWKEYHFKCKPGDIDRRPCTITPFHYRLDWLMWFAAFGDYRRHPWILQLANKLLSNDTAVRGLLAEDESPFAEDPPKFIKADRYQYEFVGAGGAEADPGVGVIDADGFQVGRWWRRKLIAEYFPPVS